jgi:hypothetical protein
VGKIYVAEILNNAVGTIKKQNSKRGFRRKSGEFHLTFGADIVILVNDAYSYS